MTMDFFQRRFSVTAQRDFELIVKHFYNGHDFGVRLKTQMSGAETSGYSDEPISDTPMSSKSSSVTPMIRHRKQGVVNPAVFVSPGSPLFTKEDQIRIHKQRTELEIQVATLKQRLTTLRFEAQKVKANIVTPGELTVLKAETRSLLSSEHSMKLNDLMNNLTETMRDVAAASATCSTLEHMIDDEIQQREKQVAESQTIAEILSFCDCGATLPQIPNKNLNGTDADYTWNADKLTELRNQMMSIEGRQGNRDLESDAALQMARSAESQWHLKSVGTLALRNEMQRLQRCFADGESELRKMERAKEDEKRKLDAFVDASNHDEGDIAAKFAHAKAEYQQQIQQMDDELSQLKMRVNASAHSYDRICTEINEIRSNEFAQVHPIEDEEEEDDESECVLENPANNLVERKQSLQREIRELEKKYKQTRRAVKKKQADLKSTIRALNSRYMTLHDEKERRAGTLIAEHTDSLQLQREIASLIDKIDSSITDLRSGLARDH